MAGEENFRKSDYVTDVLSKFNAGYMRLDERLTTPEIRDRAKTFEKNVHKTILLAQLPEFVARESRFLTQIQDVAIQSIPTPENLVLGSPEYLAYVNERLPDALLYVQAEFDRTATTETRKAQFLAAENTLLFIFDPESGHPALDALEALYISLIVNIWTAFESMAGDLWETALNVHPKTLANLSGQDKRISKLANVKQRSTGAVLGTEQSGATIRLNQLHDLTKGTYEIANKLGTILKGRHKFTILDGARIAYSEAFSINSDSVDQALADHSLDMLAALRNVFVHKAGIADQEYDAKRKSFPDLPQFELDTQIILTGATVRNRVNSVIKSGVDLLVAVDEWILSSSK